MAREGRTQRVLSRGLSKVGNEVDGFFFRGSARNIFRDFAGALRCFNRDMAAPHRGDRPSGQSRSYPGPSIQRALYLAC